MHPWINGMWHQHSLDRRACHCSSNFHGSTWKWFWAHIWDPSRSDCILSRHPWNLICGSLTIHRLYGRCMAADMDPWDMHHSNSWSLETFAIYYWPFVPGLHWPSRWGILFKWWIRCWIVFPPLFNGDPLFLYYLLFPLCYWFFGGVRGKAMAYNFYVYTWYVWEGLHE